MAEQNLLDLERRDILAPAPDGVLEAIDKPTVEVHITNIHARELFRRRTITGDAADAVIAGLGWHGYIIALESLFTIPITRKRKQ